ncbi:MAG: nucleotide sugar dehydrogenase, partial [Pseudomonadota bacterium]|nr:nucleotide sugar dehydrogenase [Pseudomonadota bacterium]
AAVSHKEYLAMSLAELTAKLKQGGIFTDVKSVYDQKAIKAAGFKLWRL